MKEMENYLSKLGENLPDLSGRFNIGADAGQWEDFEKSVSCKIPSELSELYKKMNGESSSVYTGFFAGLTFLPLETVLSEFEYFKSTDIELMVMGTNAIQEAPVEKLTWIPFAFDGSSAYLAMDLTPSKEGKNGQIITVDFEYDNCYLLADSLKDLFAKMTTWLQQGTLIIDKENGEPFISEKSGHLFNALDDLTMSEDKENEKLIALPDEFWKEQYKAVSAMGENGSASVPLSCLVKEKKMWIREQELSCEPIAYMENVKELIFHDCKIENLHCIAQAPQLQKLIFARCTFCKEDLSVLSAAPKLKELSINVMDGAGLSALKDIKTLKCLNIRKITGVDEKTLSGFTKLQELSIEDMDIHDASFIGNMVGMKKLELGRLQLNDLDFLKNLKKLTEFELAMNAADETGLSALGSLTKLKSFIYPVRDLSIYKGHPSLIKVGFAKDVDKGFEVFAGSPVNSFTVIGTMDDNHGEQIRKEMEKYVNISSYGSRE